MKIEPVKQVKLTIALLILFFLAIILISLFYNITETKKQYLLMAKESAKSLFMEIVITRRWNAMHGGVYLPVSESIKPNPYLKDPLRDITTTEGMKLTKINPAFMTRLISEFLEKDRSIEFHITSKNPLNPSNFPDRWEEESLNKFRTGVKERHSIIGKKDKKYLRYMAPLLTEKSCLKCHALQGYKEGDIRGGISIKIPFDTYENSISALNNRLVILHILFFIIGVIVISSLGYMLLKNLQRITVLKGLLPICSNCKKIRDDQGYWEQVESYFETHSEVFFTHGICPDCSEKIYGKNKWYKKKKPAP